MMCPSFAASDPLAGTNQYVPGNTPLSPPAAKLYPNRAGRRTAPEGRLTRSTKVDAFQATRARGRCHGSGGRPSRQAPSGPQGQTMGSS
ncbi:hypothetical protein Sme01_68670 [Sphaerisporangium melleum]|uniref:Uncharacterized protein n=1 Tax=Sphaerisporangium melleum TaxID=321316 RepID=A0A917RL55_9ACTN|nr:hypothetical protein GCM10007964_62700 [Sphaerisporangium melleum]GII74391.1 hypothetical protein Sme01_68670 [Sphaerisporangium melleum]